MSSVRYRETWRDALRALNRDPGDGWRSILVHHGFRALVVLGIAALVPVLFPRLPIPQAVSLEEGMVATEDVISAFDVTVRKPASQLEAEQLEAERSVAPIYLLEPAAADSAVAHVRTFFVAVDSLFAGAADGTPDSAAVAAVGSAFGVELSGDQLAYLAAQRNRRALRTALEAAYRNELPGGVASILDLGGQSAAHVLIRGPERDRILPRDSVVTVGRFLRDAVRYLPGATPAGGVQLFQSLLVRFAVASLQPDDAGTEAARRQARAAVDSTAGVILEGERIISAHERVGRRELQRLLAYNAELTRLGLASGARLEGTIGGTLYGVLMLSLLGAVLFYFRPAIYRDLRGFLIIMGLVALVLVSASLIALNEYAPELIPVALLALLIGALYDGLIALITVLVTAALVGGQMAFSGMSVPFLMLASGSTAALGIRRVRRRSHSWVLIALISAAYLLAGTALALILSQSARDLVTTVGWGIVSATLATVLAVAALIPALEKITGISTDQSLLELSDLNGPLLRDLSRKAPGTYVHSINVANLAEAACTAIGANPLLARAGVYYHDIGKMLNPQYFVENQPKGRNPHDRLPPTKSAAIIRDHVREGLRLASEHRLPPVIHDFIREHHGTTVISYFFDKARSEDPDLELDPADFAYAGPKPQTKETAVVMLADGIESASRVLQDPTPDRIRATIEQMVAARIDESQLDQCPLTLRDLDLVKIQFSRVLIGMYHRRIEYPSGVRARPDLPLAEGPAAEIESHASEAARESG